MSPGLSEEGRALADQRLAAGLEMLGGSTAGNSHSDRAEPTMRGRASGSCAPASYAARRMWFLDQLQPGRPTYLVPLPLRLRGRLDLAAWKQALQDLVDRHEVLRTTYSDRDAIGAEELTQVVATSLTARLDHVDLTTCSATERERAWEQLIEQELQQPFDLRTGPLFRARLLSWSPGEHRMLLTLHHSCVDGWALGLLVHDLAAVYAARTNGSRTPQPPSVSYRDFTLWQRERVESGMLTDQLDYWTEQLSGATATELPTDRHRPDVLGWRAGRHSITLDADLTAAVHRAAQRTQSSAYTVLLAAFNALLHRYVGHDDIVVGTPVADRAEPETEGVVGMVANTLVMRTDVSGDPTFDDLVYRARETVLGAYAHGEVPFELLVERLAPERDPARQPLFQIAFVLQNLPPFERVPAGDLTIERLDIPAAAAKFDLSVTVTEVDPEPDEAGAGNSDTSSGTSPASAAADRPSAALRCEWEYSTDLFDAATIERLAQRYRTCLREALAEPGLPISALALLDADERQLLRHWSRADVEHRRAPPAVLERVGNWIATTPNAVAICDTTETVTYAELGRNADQVAAHLIAFGAGPEQLVAVCVDRSAELAVALLGVLRSGAGYVALEPAYPTERLRQIVDDAQPVAVLCEEDVVARFAQTQTPVLPLRDLRPGPDDPGPPAGTPTTPQPPTTSAPESHQRAYVVYTSGSTGRPKGVEIEHRGLANLLDWHLNAYQLGPDDDTTLVAGPGFDASTMELWTGLAAGATVHVPAEELRSDPAALTAWLVETGITSTMLPTATAEAVAARLCAPDAASGRLRFLHTAGDALTVVPTDPVVAIVNHYGPSENSVEATATEATGLRDEGRRPPIGRPITGVSAYVLDNNGALAPIGVPGELYLGGCGVARGYLGDPIRTAERFLPDPFSSRPAARMYRTGDLARWLPDGQLDFLGRSDRQVSIRGHRVELGEVEAALRDHPEVREAVALVRGSNAAERTLVAVLLLADAAQVNADELRIVARRRLPSAMVPSSYVVVDDLPRTTGGKVDRAAVQMREARPLERRTTLDPPQTPTEHALAELWSDALDVAEVNRGDDFFELGGHSFLALRLQRRIGTRFGVEIAVVELFQHPKLAALARRIDAIAASAVSASVPPEGITVGAHDRPDTGHAAAGSRRREARARLATRRRGREGA